MSGQDMVPFLPENAPFTAEQRAYLNGFLAGLFSRAPGPQIAGQPPGANSKPLIPLAILFGSQTGTAESLSRRISREAGRRGFAPTIHDMGKYSAGQLAGEKHLLIVTSTYGDGEPPDNARGFWELLNAGNVSTLSSARFSVCALGDSNYPKFCAFGRDLDAKLEALGAHRVLPRVDCDVEFEEPFAKWLNEALRAIAGPEGNAILSMASTSPESVADANNLSEPVYNRDNPLPAKLLTNRMLNAAGSQKDTRHFEIELDAGLSYEVGDALGVIPSNCPELVEEILSALRFSGDEPVRGKDGKEVPLREAMLRHHEITKISQPFLKAMAERSQDELLNRLVAPTANGELTKFLWGREIIDVLLAHPSVRFTPQEFTGLLKKIQPRLYSISSSQKAHSNQVHLTVSTVRYESLARKRKGVCSTFLAERALAGNPVPVFVHKNANFRLPTDAAVPVIMIGPGTGIAPFRAFLEERQAVGATGKNWLFFGDQRGSTDFLYRDELEAMQANGKLTRLDTAFSRDQAEKIYVQHRMMEKAAELWSWLDAGAHLYVCGDAARMAKDVDAALHRVIETAGGKSEDEAKALVAKMKSEKRYQRDVY